MERGAVLDGQVAARGFQDGYEQSEYLTIDVTGYDNQTWGPPWVVVEHENSGSVEKINDCAWKLLSVRADLRVLVCYIDPTGVHDAPKTVADLELAEVLRDNAGRHLAVIVGTWEADPTKTGGWNRVFELKCFHGRAVGA